MVLFLQVGGYNFASSQKGPKCNPNNYRAISLINSLSTVFTNIISKRLTKWCKSNQIIDESQDGFRRRYSTIDNIFTLQVVVQKYLSKRKGRFNVFIQTLKTASDGCGHSKLWSCIPAKVWNMVHFLAYSNLSIAN